MDKHFNVYNFNFDTQFTLLIIQYIIDESLNNYFNLNFEYIFISIKLINEAYKKN